MTGKNNQPEKSNGIEPVLKAVETFMRSSTNLYGLNPSDFDKAIRQKVNFLQNTVGQYVNGLAKAHMEVNRKLTSAQYRLGSSERPTK